MVQAGKEDEAKRLLRDVIKTCPAWTEVIAFLRATKGQPRDPIDVVLDVERKLGKKWSQAMRELVRDNYVSILAYAGFIKSEGGKVVSIIEDIPIQDKTLTKTATLPVKSPSSLIPAMVGQDFAQLHSDDFVFQIRKDASAMDFAKAQFEAWIGYLKRTISGNQNSNGQPHVDGGT